MLEDKVVAVTGAGGGIGREIALLCAREGACVVVNDFGTSSSGEGKDAGPASQVVAEIEAAGGKACANLASVTDSSGAASIIEDAVNTFGRIDAVVNNAGILRDRIFHRMNEAEWRAVIDVHLHGSFLVSQAAAPHFKEQGSGAFIHFTSTSGLIGNFGQANYSAAKLGIVGLSNSIALDMQRFGIRSNCIAPFAWSRMIGTIQAETEDDKRRVERMKSMSAAKIAPFAAFLASDASKDVSGQIFAVRKNEIFLFSVPRPLRSVHRSDGWTVETIASELLPALKPSFHPLQRSTDIFSWDPI
ncbi:SDR family NAD(P)-dependent oxidoreductase [Sphingobium sp. AR-3-1]|uniref:SDR family NAD(P)-dependent oxidoreductase n=1 Tax=Sphingobium psychrophilum TaxID=2728834 RepID=A0A7X9X0Z3_9SPHN|nr:MULTISPECIES: SDR family NAD(P)-dependent oxidoreductase [Sphingobium]NML13153.1 SDR family NAD(P)-dependent oxidoreductase [Sphingobium psychrophilum]